MMLVRCRSCTSVIGASVTSRNPSIDTGIQTPGRGGRAIIAREGDDRLRLRHLLLLPDGDFLSLRFHLFAPRKRDGQHALGEGRGDLVRVHRLGKRERAPEGAITT